MDSESRNFYPAARLVAPRIQAHFERHLAAASPDDRARAPLADAPVVEAMIDAAFWASLRREEGYVPKISLAYVPPDNDGHPLRFGRPLPLEAGVLSKVAPIVERPGIHLGVWPVDGTLAVWGTVRGAPPLAFVLEVVEPGLLVVKHVRSEGTGKYVNVAVLEGDQFKIVDEGARQLPECPTFLASLLGLDPPERTGSANVLIQLAVSMREHRRGGSLLIVPAANDEWRESIITPVTYAVDPPYRGLTSLLNHSVDDDDPYVWQRSLREAVDGIASLTAVDGATIVTDHYELLAFGAKIMRRRGAGLVEQVTVTEPIEGNVPLPVTPPQLGGTRHLSAAQFVHDQHDAYALVASQDRRFTLFAWSPSSGVFAHRVESLLL